MSACFCMGPQNGEPLCPCQMRCVKIINGRYVKVEDLGPVNNQIRSISDFFQNQEPLGPDFSKVLFDNLSDLYVTDVDSPKEQDDNQKITKEKDEE